MVTCSWVKSSDLSLTNLSWTQRNLANLPSGSKYGELVKSCFVAPENWLYAGADFSALEDKIVAILSDDPMKQKPFTEGIDSHCLSAYGYFKTQMPDITPENLNDIKQKYDGLRSKSKAPTFALNFVPLHSNVYRKTF